MDRVSVVYLVTEASGSYGEYRERTIRAYSSESAAQAASDILTAAVAKVTVQQKRYDDSDGDYGASWDRLRKRMTRTMRAAGDAEGGVGSTYGVMPLELVVSA